MEPNDNDVLVIDDGVLPDTQEAPEIDEAPVTSTEAVDETEHEEEGDPKPGRPKLSAEEKIANRNRQLKRERAEKRQLMVALEQQRRESEEIRNRLDMLAQREVEREKAAAMTALQIAQSNLTHSLTSGDPTKVTAATQELLQAERLAEGWRQSKPVAPAPRQQTADYNPYRDEWVERNRPLIESPTKYAAVQAASAQAHREGFAVNTAAHFARLDEILREDGIVTSKPKAAPVTTSAARGGGVPNSRGQLSLPKDIYNSLIQSPQYRTAKTDEDRRRLVSNYAKTYNESLQRAKAQGGY
jgi:hypothetical protein